jgi:hypothetical protein
MGAGQDPLDTWFPKLHVLFLVNALHLEWDAGGVPTTQDDQDDLVRRFQPKQRDNVGIEI